MRLQTRDTKTGERERSRGGGLLACVHVCTSSSLLSPLPLRLLLELCGATPPVSRLYSAARPLALTIAFLTVSTPFVLKSSETCLPCQRLGRDSLNLPLSLVPPFLPPPTAPLLCGVVHMVLSFCEKGRRSRANKRAEERRLCLAISSLFVYVFRLSFCLCIPYTSSPRCCPHNVILSCLLVASSVDSPRLRSCGRGLSAPAHIAHCHWPMALLQSLLLAVPFSVSIEHDRIEPRWHVRFGLLLAKCPSSRLPSSL